MEESSAEAELDHVHSLKVIFLCAFLSPWLLVCMMFSDFGLKGIGPLECLSMVFGFTGLLLFMLIFKFPDELAKVIEYKLIRTGLCYFFGTISTVLFLFGVGSVVVSETLAITPENDSELHISDYRAAALQLIAYPELKPLFKTAMNDGKLSEKEFMSIMGERKFIISGKEIILTSLERL